MAVAKKKKSLLKKAQQRAKIAWWHEGGKLKAVREGKRKRDDVKQYVDSWPFGYKVLDKRTKPFRTVRAVTSGDNWFGKFLSKAKKGDPLARFFVTLSGYVAGTWVNIPLRRKILRRIRAVLEARTGDWNQLNLAVCRTLYENGVTDRYAAVHDPQLEDAVHLAYAELVAPRMQWFAKGGHTLKGAERRERLKIGKRAFRERVRGVMGNFNFLKTYIYQHEERLDAMEYGLLGDNKKPNPKDAKFVEFIRKILDEDERAIRQLEEFKDHHVPHVRRQRMLNSIVRITAWARELIKDDRLRSHLLTEIKDYYDIPEGSTYVRAEEIVAQAQQRYAADKERAAQHSEDIKQAKLVQRASLSKKGLSKQKQKRFQINLERERYYALLTNALTVMGLPLTLLEKIKRLDRKRAALEKPQEADS